MNKYWSTLSIFFFGLAWLLPNKYPPWESFYNDFCMLAALWTLWLSLTIHPTKTFDISRWQYVSLLLIIVPIAQILTRQISFAGDGWIASLYLCGFVSAVWLPSLAQPTQRLQLSIGFAVAVLISTLISVVIALHQWLHIAGMRIFIADYTSQIRPYANLAQANNLATLLWLGLASSTYLSATHRLRLASATLINLLLIIGIALAGSRTSLLVAGFVALMALHRHRTSQNFRQRLLPLLVGLIFFLAMFFWGIGAISQWLLLADSTDFARSLAVDSPRLLIWKQALSAIALHPWLGYGWNQGCTAQVAVILEYTPHVAFCSSHNILLDLLIWNGVPLGLFIVGAGAYWLITRTLHSKTLESWYALLCISMILIHGMLELPLEYAYFLLPLGFFCGLVEVDHPQKAIIAIHRRWLWIPVAAGFGMLVWVWVEYRTIEDDYRLMRFETLRIGTLKAAQPAPDVILLDQLREDIRFARAQAKPNMSAAELDWMRTVAHRFPYYASLFRYSLALALNGRYDEATLELTRMCHMYPAKQCPIAIAQIHKLADERYPQLRAWRLPSADTLAPRGGIHKT